MTITHAEALEILSQPQTSRAQLDMVRAYVNRVEEDLHVCRRALEFYANGKNWEGVLENPPRCNLTADGGDIANSVLATLKEKA